MMSSKPNKQRISLVKAPLHKKRKLLTAKLSEEMVSKYGVRRIGLRVGDTVKILRGDWVGHEGKVVKVDLKMGRIHVEGVTVKKADGTPVYYPIHPSKVMVTKLDVSDKWREKIINRLKGGR